MRFRWLTGLKRRTVISSSWSLVALFRTTTNSSKRSNSSTYWHSCSCSFAVILLCPCRIFAVRVARGPFAPSARRPPRWLEATHERRVHDGTHSPQRQDLDALRAQPPSCAQGAVLDDDLLGLRARL